MQPSLPGVQAAPIASCSSQNWYAMLDTQEVVFLGAFESFGQASDAADKATGGVANWIFDEEGLKATIASGQAALTRSIAA